MGTFNGYLYKAVKTGAVFPLQYIQFSTYSTTPNQREELKAYRDDNTRNLTRVTASGKKSVFEHKTRKNLRLTDMQAIQDWIYYNEENTQEAHDQRKIQLEFWDVENYTYKTGTFYVPNIEYKIVRVEEHDIIFDEFKLKYVEY